MSDLSGRTILVIEDEPLIALDIIETFQGANARVEVAASRAAAQPRVRECGPKWLRQYLIWG